MKSFIIFQKDDPLSVHFAKEATVSALDHQMDVHLFYGIEPDRVAATSAQHNIKFQRELGDGTKGCLLSHFLLWNYAIKSGEPIIIMEHDAIVISNPEELVPLVKDACHLDYHIPFNSNLGEKSDRHAKVYTHNIVENRRGGVEPYPDNKFYGETGVTCFRGAYGYIITPSGARKAIAYGRRNGFMPADRMLCSAAMNTQRSKCTHIRLNPFFKSIWHQRNFSTR